MILWCLGFVFFLFLLIFAKLAKLRELLEHFGFRILTDIAIESIDESRVKKILKKIIKEAVREVLSEIKIKELGDDKPRNKQN